MKELVQRGWADVWAKSVTYLPGNEAEYGPRVLLDRARALEVLSDDAHWDYEQIDDAAVRYFLLVTDIGDRDWHEDLRRRGLSTLLLVVRARLRTLQIYAMRGSREVADRHAACQIADLRLQRR